MSEDLLTKIKRETHGRLETLRAAMEESDRLRVELRALEAQPEIPRDDLDIEDADPEIREAALDTEEIASGIEEGAPEHSSNVIRLPAARPMKRTPLVSPKITRLMRSRQSLSIERSEAGLLDEVDAETERYEQAS
jgi:hypothetical protein